MGIGGVCGEITAKSVSIAIVVVCWVNKGSLGANADVVLVFAGTIGVWLRRGNDAISGYRGPRSRRWCLSGGFDLSS